MLKLDKKYLNEIWYAESKRVLTTLANKSVDVVFSDIPYKYDLDYWDNNWKNSFNLAEWTSLSLSKVKEDGAFMVFESMHVIKNVIEPIVNKFKDASHDFKVIDIVDCSKYCLKENIDIYNEHMFLLIAVNKSKIGVKDREKRWLYNRQILDVFNETNIDKDLWGFKPIEVSKKRPKFKSVRLLSEIINSFTYVDDIILDSVCGIGSIPIACYYVCRDFIAFGQDSYYLNRAQRSFRYIKKYIPQSIFLIDDYSTNSINSQIDRWDNRWLYMDDYPKKLKKVYKVITAGMIKSDIYKQLITTSKGIVLNKDMDYQSEIFLDYFGGGYSQLGYDDYLAIGKLVAEKDFKNLDKINSKIFNLYRESNYEYSNCYINTYRYGKFFHINSKPYLKINNRNYSTYRFFEHNKVIFVEGRNNKAVYNDTKLVTGLKKFNKDLANDKIQNDITGSLFVKGKSHSTNEIYTVDEVGRSAQSISQVRISTYRKLTLTEFLKMSRVYLINDDGFKLDNLYEHYCVNEGWRVISILRNKYLENYKSTLKNRNVDFVLQPKNNGGYKVSLLDLRNYERYFGKNVSKTRIKSFNKIAIDYYETVLMVMINNCVDCTGQELVVFYKSLFHSGKYANKYGSLVVSAVNNLLGNIQENNYVNIGSINKLVLKLHITSKRAIDYDLRFFYIYTLKGDTKHKLLKGKMPKSMATIRERNRNDTLILGKRINDYLSEGLTYKDVVSKINLTRRIVAEKHKTFVLNQYKHHKRSLNTDAKLIDFANAMNITVNKLHKWTH